MGCLLAALVGALLRAPGSLAQEETDNVAVTTAQDLLDRLKAGTRHLVINDHLDFTDRSSPLPIMNGTLSIQVRAVCVLLGEH